jgi:hypothetical protein
VKVMWKILNRLGDNWKSRCENAFAILIMGALFTYAFTHTSHTCVDITNGGPCDK